MKRIAIYSALWLLLLGAQGCKPSKPTGTKPSGTTPSTVNVLANASYAGVEAQRNFYLSLAQQYGADALQIMKAEEDHKALVSYADGNTRDALVNDYGTVVHEACHAYNFKIGGFEYYGYFITDKIKILAPKTEVFNANLLNSVVPKDLQKKIFRYNTYIGDNSGVSSQVNGIYGMMNEFSAYYHGTKAQLELFNYYKSKCPQPTQDCWEPYLSNMSSEIYAYHEFRLFMAWYLNYTQKNYPAMYQSMMANKPLRMAFSLLNNLYAQTVKDYGTRRNEMMAIFKEKGMDVRVEEDFIRFYTGTGYSGSGVPDGDIAFLESLLGTKEKAQLDAFIIPGATLQNYESLMR